MKLAIHLLWQLPLQQSEDLAQSERGDLWHQLLSSKLNLVQILFSLDLLWFQVQWLRCWMKHKTAACPIIFGYQYLYPSHQNKSILLRTSYRLQKCTLDHLAQEEWPKCFHHRSHASLGNEPDCTIVFIPIVSGVHTHQSALLALKLRIWKEASIWMSTHICYFT